MVIAIMTFVVFILTSVIYVVLGKTYKLDVDLAAVFCASVAIAGGFFFIAKSCGV
mgnify:CR=1 FL=1